MAPTAILIATLIGACVLIISYKLDSSRHYLLGASERLPPHFGGDVHRCTVGAFELVLRNGTWARADVGISDVYARPGKRSAAFS